MSQQMRDLMTRFASLLNESSVNRVYNHLIKHECSIITSYRKSLTNCLDGDDEKGYVNIRINNNRNRHLKSALLYLGYSVTKVKGTYIENFAEQLKRVVITIILLGQIIPSILGMVRLKRWANLNLILNLNL